MLLEREAGLARVREALAAAGEGESSLMLLTGPLGIGRSALLQQLPALAAEKDVRVMRANAALMEVDFAFGVVRQLFDSLLASAPEEARLRWMEAADRHAHHVFSVDGAEAAHDVSAFEAILPSLRSLLAHVSDETPLLVLVDDLQWVDEPSLRWLAYLSKRLHGLRVLLVCSLRDGDPRAVNPLVREVKDALAEEVRLAPLTPEATKVMIREQFGEPGDAEYVRACHDVSAGNPLFLITVLLGMAVSGYRPTAGEADKARSLRPSELRERLAGCLRTQPAPVRDLAAAITVFGERGDTELITRLAGLDGAGFSSALRALRDLGLLADDQEPRFGHRVVEDAVESSMTVAEWERLHASAAALLYQSGRPAEQVAAQLMLVTNSGPDWAALVLRSAADTALRRGAPEIAARYLLRALLYSPAQNEDRARLLIDLATAERAFDPAACERHIAQAVPLLRTARDRASAVLRIPPTLLSRPSTASVALLREVSEGLRTGEASDAAAGDMSLRLEARLRHYGQESPAELAAAAERLKGLGVKPPLETAAERELVTVLLGAATLGGRISAAEAAHSANRVLEREPATTSVRARTVLSLLVMTLCAADSVDAISSWLVTESPAPGEAASDADSALLLAERALLLVSRGRPARAQEYAGRAVRLADPEWREASTVVLSAVALELRDTELTERIMAKAGRVQPVSLALTTMLRMLHASLDAESGQRARALESLLACGRQLEAAGWRNSSLFAWRPRAIRLYERLGDTRSALALADEEHEWAASWGAPSTLGRALRLKGALQGERGVPMLRQAVRVLRDSANELELARALAVLGRALGGGSEAAEALHEARALASACGAHWLAERAENGPASAAQQQDASALTRSERRILGLVRRGLTNQEIASKLSVSSRAVEKHLTNSYRKLGVSGRREVVEFLSDPDALQSR